MKNFKIKKVFSLAFTLAEIMIALVVIGVITSILLPVAFNSVPDENVMKFKKGNATLAKVINELVSSDKYYSNGDLGTKADGSKDTAIYFMASFADNLSIKENVKEITLADDVGTYLTLARNQGGYLGDPESVIQSCETHYFNLTDEDIKIAKERFDKTCEDRQKTPTGAEVTTTDGIQYFQTGVAAFGEGASVVSKTDDNKTSITHCNTRFMAPPNQTPYIADSNGMDIVYKIFCMDIDGINQGEDPFGYGIRADGKILTGKRADEWLEKSIQDKE